ncbi:hypothetical protein [Variovorax sp. Root411]|uniref:hypothetical protein n=1 Tax=Variovorax sp. Root411 TaxID=1736530 RepID=UPI0006F96B00|nr:hypothetical protein [Variovorax sp. Root411]KQW57053.1 hypothetical protein ASC92_12375 [Variovorax sp. Root411]
MSRYLPPSLLQHFASPDDYVGTFGWLCGYSADASFLDAAAERFTQQAGGQRGYAGKLALVVLLDRGQPQILPHEAAGVLHAPLRDATRFALLHAKVALLGFRHVQAPERWRMRLLVCTGNWTRQTLERSLDLAWSVEVGAEDLESREPQSLQARADVAAAWDLLQWLMPLFDLRALAAEPHSLTGLARGQFASWCEALPRRNLPRPRFFDSRNRSLLRQLPDLARRQAGEADRNTLVLGSGFYEGGEGGQAPVALVRIVDALKEAGMVTASCDVSVIVEPTDCQAVATALPAMHQLGWRVWPAGQPEFLGRPARSLHAKFVFASSYRKNSNTCLNGWLYLGSGNLTAPGFLNPCPRGNLEVGVVVGEDSLYWHKSRGLPSELWAGNRLPLQWEREVLDAQELQGGPGMPDRPPVFEAPPVAWCRYLSAQDGLPARLLLPVHDVPLEVLDTESSVCTPVGSLEVAWPGAPQPSVVVRWHEGGLRLQCSIPVIDAAGRIAALELPKLDLESAWWQLQQFPQPPAEEDTGTDEREFEPGMALVATASPAAMDSVVRTMMRLVENIADKQAGLMQADWDAWCISLEQALRQAADCVAVKAFAAQLRLDPLDVLRQEGSLPAFARDAQSPQRERYLAVLDALAACWGVQGLPSVGRHGGKCIELV